ncbi:MAG: amidohydrolase family protein [Gammaproteobacteria bacterium]
MHRLTLMNARLVDADLADTRPATIVIDGDRISAVNFDGAPPALPDELRLDLGGRSVMPGMINCHYHATYHNVGGAPLLPVGMDAPPPLQAMRAMHHLQLALRSGFTGVVSGGAPFAIDASAKMAIEAGLFQGPRIVAGSRDVSSTGHSQDSSYPWYWEGSPPGIVRTDGADAYRRAVREEVRRGAEIIKIFLTSGHAVPGVPAPMDLTREELAAAISAAHERLVKVRAHIATRAAILTAVELGIDVVDHGDGLDAECIDRLVAAGTFLVPSCLYTYRVSRMFSGAWADRIRRDTDLMLEVLPAANKAGVKLLLGDDFGAVPLDHGMYADELEFYVRTAGIAARDVIGWATRNGAALMGLGDELGSIRPGFLADLLVVDGDPLVDISILKDRSRLLLILKAGAVIVHDQHALPALAPGAERRVAG